MHQAQEAESWGVDVDMDMPIDSLSMLHLVILNNICNNWKIKDKCYNQ